MLMTAMVAMVHQGGRGGDGGGGAAASAAAGGGGAGDSRGGGHHHRMMMMMMMMMITVMMMMMMMITKKHLDSCHDAECDELGDAQDDQLQDHPRKNNAMILKNTLSTKHIIGGKFFPQ